MKLIQFSISNKICRIISTRTTCVHSIGDVWRYIKWVKLFSKVIHLLEFSTFTIVTHQCCLYNLRGLSYLRNILHPLHKCGTF